MTTYRIELKPLDRFFFGGDRTFGSNNENYYVRSRYFPQQTTLLGLMRYMVLKEKWLMNSSGKSVPDEHKWIGNSFNHEKNEGFGIIKQLSPVFITGSDGDYFVQSREYGLQNVHDPVAGIIKDQVIPLVFKTRKGTSYVHSKSDAIPCFEGITSKISFPHLLVNTQTGRMRYFLYQRDRQHDPMNGIFIADDQVGIRKYDRDEDKGFFRQVFYQLADDYCFAFYVTLADEDFILENNFYKIGSDQTWFKVSLKKEPDFNITTFGENAQAHFAKPTPLTRKIVLISDTYLDIVSYHTMNLFASSETTPFNYIQTKKTGTNGDYQNTRAGISMRKSEHHFELLSRGSVLYVEEGEKQEILKTIKGQNPLLPDAWEAAFYSIGYNHAI